MRDQLERPSDTLVLGCGMGHEVAALRRAGRAVLGIEIQTWKDAVLDMQDSYRMTVWNNAALLSEEVVAMLAGEEEAFMEGVLQSAPDEAERERSIWYDTCAIEALREMPEGSALEIRESCVLGNDLRHPASRVLLEQIVRVLAPGGVLATFTMEQGEVAYRSSYLAAMEERGMQLERIWMAWNRDSAYQRMGARYDELLPPQARYVPLQMRFRKEG